jgi:hypothetical protein
MPPRRETASSKKKKPGQFTSRRRHLTENTIEPRRPDGAGWERAPDAPTGGETWVNPTGGLVAVTDVIHAPRPTYRLALRQDEGGRCTAAQVLSALVDFGLLDAQESDFTRHGDTRIFTCPIAAP